MPIAELTAEGMEIQTLQEILDGIAADQRDPDTGIDPDVDNTPESSLGVANAIVSERLRELCELLVALWGSPYPSMSQGQALSFASQLTGTNRRAATKSRVTVTVNLDPGVTLVAGDAAHVVDRPLDRYEIPVGTSVSNSGGVAASFPVVMEASVAGSTTRANSGRLTVIATPKAGWNSVTNALDSVPGKDEETDTELRIRRVRELNSKAGATYDRMRAQLSLVADVTDVEVIENSTNEWRNSVPPKSFEALVLGGLDQAIWDTIWKNKPQGVEPFGAEVGSADDVNGNPHEVAFSRPAEVEMYVSVVVRRGRGYVGDEAVKEAIVDAGRMFGIGSLVIFNILRCAPLHAGGLESPLNGVIDVKGFKIGKSLSTLEYGDNIQMGNREKPVFDTSRVNLRTATS